MKFILNILFIILILITIYFYKNKDNNDIYKIKDSINIYDSIKNIFSEKKILEDIKKINKNIELNTNIIADNIKQKIQHKFIKNAKTNSIELENYENYAPVNITNINDATKPVLTNNIVYQNYLDVEKKDEKYYNDDGYKPYSSSNFVSERKNPYYDKVPAESLQNYFKDNVKLKKLPKGFDDIIKQNILDPYEWENTVNK